MKIILDNQILRLLKTDCSFLEKNPIFADSEHPIIFTWPNLLEYLDLGSLVSNLSIYDRGNTLFDACITTMHAHKEEEVIFHIYDHLFAENLKQIKNLAPINAAFLLQAVEKHQNSASGEMKKKFSTALKTYEENLKIKASDLIHDLTLYLAWDRMCMSLVSIFNYQSTDPNFLYGIKILKECLIESYQHIKEQGRTSPGIFRMLEAVFFYEMREENLQKHTEDEWAILSQSFPILRQESDLSDFFYIDHAVDVIKEESKEESVNYWTFDAPETVNLRQTFAKLMINKLKAERPQWAYTIHTKNIFYANS